jgi:hypothetical protein
MSFFSAGCRLCAKTKVGFVRKKSFFSPSPSRKGGVMMGFYARINLKNTAYRKACFWK